jgi:hypothetical protein
MKTQSAGRKRAVRPALDNFADSVVLLTMAVMVAGSIGALLSGALV